MTAEEYIFEVPFGLDLKGVLVSRAEAAKGAAYKCPGCLSSLILKKGEVRRVHFSHSSGTSCSLETMLHKTAKMLVVKMVLEWKEGRGKLPNLFRSCVKGCGAFTQMSFPDGMKGAKEERRLPSGRVVDVALLDGETILMGVEILVSHRVDDEKRGEIAVPWIEVPAETVVSGVDNWQLTQDGPAPFECTTCRSLRLGDEDAKEKARRLGDFLKTERLRLAAMGNEPKLKTPPPFAGLKLKLKMVDCGDCGARTIAWLWPDRRPWGVARPVHVPEMVKRIESLGGIPTWASHCHSCKVPLAAVDFDDEILEERHKRTER